MMGLSTIRRINAERAVEAAEQGLTPVAFDSAAEVDTLGTEVRLPHIGDHRPDGWELIDKHFVDSSGFGSENEPAMTQDQMLAMLKRKATAYGDLVGFAVIEAGQFQVYVGEFRRVVGA